MNTEFAHTVEEGVLVVGISNGGEDYLLWQRAVDSLDDVHFEHGDQLESGYNTVKECRINEHRCRVILSSGAEIDLDWVNAASEDIARFIEILRELYVAQPGVVVDQTT